MEHIGLYNQLTNFTTQHAGTAEWCKAERDGKEFFVKKFHSPVYPSKEIGLPEKMYTAGVEEFHDELNRKRELYRRLRECNQSGILVVPVEVINYQFHICTIADFVVSNVSPEQIHLLSEWQRLVLMRTLTLALMSVHKAGIVHSDMKPDNVLVTQDRNGHCKLRLIDFDGSFFESDPPMDPEDVVGDPAFFSPEAYRQSMGEEVRLDHRIDIFALGLIFHYFWSGSYPERPENRTIGECLIKDETIAINDSIPLVLKQLILRMISKDPDKRISLQSVYDVLGVQIGLRPMELTVLHPDAAGESGPKKTVSGKTTEVVVHYCDESGKTLRCRKFKIPYDSRETIVAEEIKGYHLTGPRAKEIRVLANGYVQSPVIFKFRKDAEGEAPGKTGKVLLILIALFIVYLLVMYILAQSAKAGSDFERAKQYMDAFPLYSELFPDDYNSNNANIRMIENMRAKQKRADTYEKAVNCYRSGNYSDAYDAFQTIDKDYKDTRIYLDFCLAHIYNNPKNYYSTIAGNRGFEDAEALFEQIQYNTYTKAVNYYHNSDYSGAYSTFITLERPYRDASVYIDFCLAHINHNPLDFYSTIVNNPGFEDAEALFAQAQSDAYAKAVTYYRSGNYSDAHKTFLLTDMQYKNAALYVDFCLAHTKDPLDYYSIIVDNIGFEDAADLLVIDNDIAFNFLLGTWRVQGNGDSLDYEAYKGENESKWMKNIPDRPGAGTWTIRKGIMYFTIDDNEIKLHQITVKSRNSVTFSSFTTGITYSLTRR